MTLRGFIVSPAICSHSEGSRKVPKIETHAVSVHEAISRERSGHPVLLIIEILLIVSIQGLKILLNLTNILYIFTIGD
jgi:CHASE2 domain-containing sensor protein